MNKKKITEARCINCKYYEKYKQYCNKHKMKATRFSSCTCFEKKEE